MSSSVVKTVAPASSAAPSPRLLTPKTPTIPLLAGSTAQRYNHAHALVALAYYYLRFRALVANPLGTMIQDLAPIALTQCAFCAICLPSAGTWGSGGSAIISGTATTKPAKTSVNSGTGSMKRKGGASTTFQVVPVAWKSKVTVGTLLRTVPFVYVRGRR